MYLREFVQREGIVDHAVVFHSELNPRLWDDGRMRSEVRYQLLQIVEHFVEFIGLLTINLVDVTVSGSNAAFTYTATSDLDLHLVVEVPFNKELYYTELFNAKKNQYNFTHDIKIRGIDVELYVQNSKDVHHSAGIYSVLDNKWLSTPKSIKVDINSADVTEKVKNYYDQIKMALRTRDFNKSKAVMNTIYKLRQAGLEKEGEFSVENIAFKVLRAKGIINKLREHINDLEDMALSLENRHE
jgi:hypothetical protein